MSPQKLLGEATLEFVLRNGPQGKYFPVMTITKGGVTVEAALSFHGFKYKEDAQAVLDKTSAILMEGLIEDEDNGTTP